MNGGQHYGAPMHVASMRHTIQAQMAPKTDGSYPPSFGAGPRDPQPTAPPPREIVTMPSRGEVNRESAPRPPPPEDRGGLKGGTREPKVSVSISRESNKTQSGGADSNSRETTTDKSWTKVKWITATQHE